MKKRTFALALVIVLTGCVMVDSNDERSARRAAERQCLELGRERGFRNMSVLSVDREGRDEWMVVITESVAGPNPTIRCAYNARTNRAVDSNDERSARRAAERQCLELGRNRGLRNMSVQSVDREGRDEWMVVIAESVAGPNPTIRCAYNARTNRARLER
jgi:outer membrane lipoprotein SlyB